MKVGLGTSIDCVAGEIADERARERGLAGAEIAGQRHQIAGLERDRDIRGKARRRPSSGNVTVKLVPPVAVGNIGARQRLRMRPQPGAQRVPHQCPLSRASQRQRSKSPRTGSIRNRRAATAISPAVAPHCPGGDEQKHRLQRGDIARIDRKHHADGANDLDHHARKDPGFDRIEPEIVVDLVGEFQIAGLGVEMRQQKQAANKAKNVELVGQIENLKERHTCGPPRAYGSFPEPLLRASCPKPRSF